MFFPRMTKRSLLKPQLKDVLRVGISKLLFVNVYTPNAQNELARIDTRLAWDSAYRSFLGSLAEDKPVITCGDFNVAHEEIDLKNPGPNRGNAGFSDEERTSFTRLLNAGFTDTFRTRHPDVTGAYSWWSYRFTRAKTMQDGVLTISWYQMPSQTV